MSFRRLFQNPSRKQAASKLRRRRLQMEGLENRRVLAAYINELHFDPLFGSSDEDQYLEIRGEPGGTLNDGTYFVGIESADGVGELGDVHTIIDLSGQSLGSNGMLVLLSKLKNQGLAGFEVDPNANVLAGSGDWTTVPGFSADGISKSIHAGSSTYLLVESATPPTLTDDIDADNDGTPEGPYNNWTILDGFTTFPWVESLWDQRAYAPIVFAEDGVGDSVLPGATVIHTEQQAYAGRIGASTGYSAEEWVSANTVEKTSGEYDFQFQRGVFGTPRPEAFSGRVLDHIGAPNWFGSISGTVYDDLNRDGVRQNDEPVLDNVTVSAEFSTDVNDGYQWESIDPSDYPEDTDMTNVSKSATLTTAGTDNRPLSFEVEATTRSPEGRVFSHVGIAFFNNIRRLRTDFYEPARAISVQVIGNSDLTDTYGRLEIFNKDNESLGFVRTNPLAAGQSQVLTMTRETDDIAWAVAYSDQDFMSSSAFGIFDNIRVQVKRSTSTTTSDGGYFIGNLPSGTYTVNAVGSELYNPVTFNVTIDDTEDHPGQDIGLTDRFPRLADQAYSVGELASAGHVIANLPVVTGYGGQQLDFSFTSGNDDGLFEIEPGSFELKVTRPGLDFETMPGHVLEIEFSDTSNPELNGTATIEIDVLNENDPPVVAAQEVSIDENSSNGLEVATMEATDQDGGLSGEFLWRIVSGNTGDAFQIDANSGVVSIQDNSTLDFEENPEYELVIRATDGGSPPAAGEGTLKVKLVDINESPLITEQDISIVENTAPGTLFSQLSFTDPDAGQTGVWSLQGGDGLGFFDLSDDGKLTVAENADLDFETSAEYTLDVRVTDSGDPALSDDHSFTVTLVDANDAPEVGEQTFSVDENSDAGTLVGTVAAQDEDAGQTLSYEITGGPDASKFTIDSSTGEIFVAADTILDHESLIQASIDVTVTDSHPTPKSTSQVMRIQVANVNEGPSVAANGISIDENSPTGTEAGSAIGSDPDNGDVLTYEIVSQSLDWLAIDSATGLMTVAAGAVIDFESNPENVVALKVMDQAGLSAEATVTVTANDVNDPPVVSTPLPDASVRIGEALDYQVPEGAFTDQDAGDSLRYVATTEAGFSLPTWITFDAETRTLQGTPTQNELGTLGVKISAVDSARANAFDIIQIEVLPEPFPWHNSASPLDINDDGFVSPIDALVIINYLNGTDDSEVPPGSNPEFGYIDANGDNFVTPFDALIVINELNNSSGEGESAGTAHGVPGDLHFDFNDPRDDEEELLALLAQEQLQTKAIR